MNLDTEKNGLIDISLEDDLLIDSNFDDASLDLRLSVTYDTQNELFGIGMSRNRISHEMEATPPLFPHNEDRNLKPLAECKVEECSVRRSLAWNREFFTSPGFLDHEELCIVNKAFKNADVPLFPGIQDNLRSKVCMERNSRSKQQEVPGGGLLKNKSSLKPRLSSPSMIKSTPAPKCQGTNRRSLEAFSKKVPATSNSIERSSKRPESHKTSLKSPTKMEKTSPFPTRPTKRPSRALLDNTDNIASKCVLGVDMNRSGEHDKWSTSSLSSTYQSLSSSTATFLPFNSSFSSSHGSLWRSLEIKDVVDREDSGSPSETLSLGKRKGAVAQNAPKATRKSQVPHGDIHQKTKASGLRMPSQSIGFFDMSGEVSMNRSLQLQPGAQSKYTKTRAKITKRAVNVSTSSNDRAQLAEHNRSPVPLMNKTADTKGKIFKESSKTHSSRSPPCGVLGKISKPTEKQDRKTIHGKKIHPLEKDEKENALPPENEVDVLGKQVKAMNLNNYIVIEVDGNNGGGGNGSGDAPSSATKSSTGKCRVKARHEAQTTLPKENMSPSLPTSVGASITRSPLVARNSTLKRSAFF